MEYVEISAKNAKSTETNGLTEAEKTKFFKLYVPLSQKMKKLVGRKRNSKKIQEAYKNMIQAMEILLDS